MNFFQQLSIGWTNGWWFSALFMLVNMSMLIYYPKHFKIRVLKRPDYTNFLQKICSIVSFFLFQGCIWYSILIPITLNSSFYIGVVLFAISMVGYITAMLNYATTPPNEPVTKGIYRITRNPQQLMSILLWIGVGIALGSGFIIIACILQLILSYPGFIAQEQTCLAQYGESYREYLSKTKRYF